MNQNKRNREKSQHFNQNQSQIQKYLLENPISTKTKDLKLRRKLKEINYQLKENADSKINFELLDESIGYLQGEGMERTFKFKQEEIGENVDLATNQKLFDLKLDFGEYSLDYTINGTSLLLGGKMGHLCSFDWKQKKLQHQMNVKEIVRDVTWLHNDTMYCAAQKKYSYIYDKTGMELHQLNDFIEVTALEYLRYHFLLVGVVSFTFLYFQYEL
jgi:U3 small nucleolar RNA-associated protein 7